MSWYIQRSDINSGNPVYLGTPNLESFNQQSGITVLPMPMSGEEETQVYDYMGVTTEITVQGVYADTLTNVRTFIGRFLNDDLGTKDVFVNGDQSFSGKSTYYSNLTNESYGVFVQSFTFDFEQGMDLTSTSNLIKISYTLKLIRGQE